MTFSALHRIRQDIRSMKAYSVPAIANGIKLDAMENPYECPVSLREAWARRLAQLSLHRYPSADLYQRLQIQLKKEAQVPAAYDLMLGNGSDEIIALLIMACAQENAAVLAPQPSFVMYEVSARLHRMRFVGVDLQADFSLDLPAMLEAIKKENPALIFLSYPNNPTANLFDKAHVRSIIAQAKQSQSIVVIDEAYQPFASHSWWDEILKNPQENEHVLLMRTLSKWGLAGVRLGYLIGPQEAIEHINKVRPPYNVSVLNAECALFALEHSDVFAAQAQKICQDREQMIKTLQSFSDVEIFASQANMILIRVNDAERIFQALASAQIWVKNVSTLHPLLHNCLRLTVGTPAENQALFNVLKATL